MDLARSCYKRKMRWNRFDQNDVVMATWYFCKPGALPFPAPHRFPSSNWNTFHPESWPLGDSEQYPRTYFSGRRTNRSAGVSFAGPLEYFQEGQPGPLPPLQRGSDGTPVECLTPPFGLALGGQSLPVSLAEGGLALGGSCFEPTVSTLCDPSTPYAFHGTAHADDVACLCLEGIVFDITWDGFKYVGSFTACGGHLVEFFLQCFDPDWIWTIFVDGVFSGSDLFHGSFHPVGGSDFFHAGPGACANWHVDYSP